MQRSTTTVGLLVLLSSIPFARSSVHSDSIWGEGVPVTSPRENPLDLGPADFADALVHGRRYTLQYPVEVSGVLMPWRPIKKFLDDPSPSLIRTLLKRAFAGFAAIRSTDDLFAKAGLHPYPEVSGEGPYAIPFPEGGRPDVRMGATLLQKDGTDVLTISCAACHTANLFGRKVWGLSNRFPRANEFFDFGKRTTGMVSPGLFASVLGGTSGETAIYTRLRDRARTVGVKKPEAVGLDTSLAQVALSLAHRNPDPYATFNRQLEERPRAEPLATFVADSKPGVWWNLKYKNRWLADGSVIAGNPIYTNFLWNEIGRGTDLRELERWLDENPKAVRDLTTAVFAAEAPRFTDFFPAERIDEARAKNGEVKFNAQCAGCHGTYVKAWSLPDWANRPWKERLATTQVIYGDQTHVIDVGTDPQRYQGMKSLETGLNPLAISRKNGVVIRVQKGYVPPPLVGIWARWPYFHNNSAPSLCAVLDPVSERPKSYWAGEALDPAREFDSDCNGYPMNAPAEWKKAPEYLFDTAKAGLRNTGHEMATLTKDERRDLIQFLQTL